MAGDGPAIPDDATTPLDATAPPPVATLPPGRRGTRDRAALHLVARLRRPVLDAVVRRYTRLGNQGVGWVAAAAVVTVARRRPGPLLRTGAAVWGTLALNTAVKRRVRRLRPTGPDVPPALVPAPRTHSFPSAHAAMAAAAALVLPQHVPRLRLPIVAAAAAMGASRVYCAVHWPTDVLAGTGLGLAVGGVVRRVRRPAD